MSVTHVKLVKHRIFKKKLFTLQCTWCSEQFQPSKFLTQERTVVLIAESMCKSYGILTFFLYQHLSNHYFEILELHQSFLARGCFQTRLRKSYPCHCLIWITMLKDSATKILFSFGLNFSWKVFKESKIILLKWFKV